MPQKGFVKNTCRLSIYSHELEFTPEEIQKIQSAAKHDYRCADEMLKKNNI
jgi:hypothetical protein